MMARPSRTSPFCRGRNTTPTLAWRCVGQAVTAVKPISTRAVQRGHKPMIRANGPRNSAATMIAATRAGKGRPLAPSEGREAGEGHELLRPEQGSILAAAQHDLPPDLTHGSGRL